MSDDENIDPYQRQVLGDMPIGNFYAPSESFWSGKSEGKSLQLFVIWPILTYDGTS